VTEHPTFWRDLLVALARTGPAFPALAGRHDSFLGHVGSGLARTLPPATVEDIDHETLRRYAALARSRRLWATAIALYVEAAKRGSETALAEAQEVFLSQLDEERTSTVASQLRALTLGEALSTTMKKVWHYDTADKAAAKNVDQADLSGEE
jgi:hypothetical protein